MLLIRLPMGTVVAQNRVFSDFLAFVSVLTEWSLSRLKDRARCFSSLGVHLGSLALDQNQVSSVEDQNVQLLLLDTACIWAE